MSSLKSPKETLGMTPSPRRCSGRIAKRVTSAVRGESRCRGSRKYSSASSGPAERGVIRIVPTASPESTCSASRSQERASYSSGTGTS